jgi:predicted nucleotidyltransferase component of viral defense system
MSEYLDFSVKNELCGERKDRRKLADAIRAVIPDPLAETGFREVSPFRGFNESRQYNAVFGYESLFLPEDTIKFEVGFRGDLMLAPVRQPLQTLLRDAYNPQKPVISPFDALVLSHQEAYAEKVRAALSRQIPAIRDFYDITAIADSGFDLNTPDFFALDARKLAADKSAQIDLSESKQRALQERIHSELQDALRNNSSFTLHESWKILEAIAEKATSRKGE